MSSMSFMVFEFLRLMLGFAIAAFHRPIADWVMEREQVLVIAFRQRGIQAPVLTPEGARNVYFGLGIFIILLEMARIWGLTHPETFWAMFLGH